MTYISTDSSEPPITDASAYIKWAFEEMARLNEQMRRDQADIDRMKHEFAVGQIELDAALARLEARFKQC